MITTKQSFDLKIMVRRVATGSAPFIWELHKGDAITAVRVSQTRFKSMQEAYEDGQIALKAFASAPPSRRPATTRFRRTRITPSVSNTPDDNDWSDDLDDDDDADDLNADAFEVAEPSNQLAIEDTDAIAST